jgi:hypothetical protein
MVSFDASGNVRWIVPNDQPQIATADGGVIGQSGITYDSDGNAVGEIAIPMQSWTSNTYQIGSVGDIASAIVNTAMGLWSVAGGNPSANRTAASLVPSATIVSLIPNLQQAKSYMPTVLANAINSVQRYPACAENFGTTDTRKGAFNPVNVLHALYDQIGGPLPRATFLGGKPVSSRFVYAFYIGNDPAATQPNVLYIGTSGIALGPMVLINISDWNALGGSGVNLKAMTEELLHEMGHVYAHLKPQGSGGSKIVTPDSADDLSSDNTQLIFRTCFQ